VVVFANRDYRILRAEFTNVGAGTIGPRANDMLALDRPVLDWLAMAKAMGVPATRAESLRALGERMQAALTEKGPALIEVVLG